MVSALSSPIQVGRWWLSADETYNREIVNLSDPLQDPGLGTSITIPVVMLQTGSARTALYPGVYRSPRVRTYSDKYGAPTSITDAKEISFSIVITGQSMDEIYEKWGRINSYFDRAEIAASPFPRGSGVTLIEQIGDAEQETIWDVKSGVITDVDFNLPGIDVFAAVIQLSVLPFSRGRVTVTPFGLTLPGPAQSLYLPYPGGDAPGIFELRLKDMSPAGHQITWVGLGRRWYPIMSQTDFTSWYPQPNFPSINTSANWQRILQQIGAGGLHQTGVFGVYAIVNDASPIIGAPSNINAVSDSGGTLSNGIVTVVLSPNDVNGNRGANSPRFVTTVQNPSQPGNVQDYEGFEENNLDQFSSQPTYVLASGSASASLTIDATNPPVGLLAAHFKATGDTTANSLTSASISRFMPAISSLNVQSIAYQIRPISWGTFAQSSGGSAGGKILDPLAFMPSLQTTSTTSGGAGIQPPTIGPGLAYSTLPATGVPVAGPTGPISAPTVSQFSLSNSNTPAQAGTYPTGGAWNWYAFLTWTTADGGETTPNVTPWGIPVNGFIPQVTVPSFPPGVTGFNLYAIAGTVPPSSSICHQCLQRVANPGTYQFAVNSYNALPPISNTANASGASWAYYYAYTWITPTVETAPSAITSEASTGFIPVLYLNGGFPSGGPLPAGVTGAKIYGLVSATPVTDPSKLGLLVTVHGTSGTQLGPQTVGAGTVASGPPPPTSTTGTAGGNSSTFAVGTYQVAYTFATAQGETLTSQYATIAIGVPSGITVTIPGMNNNAMSTPGLMPSNASGIRIYVTTAGGNTSTATLANPGTFGSLGPNAIGPGNGTTFPPSSNSTVAATAPSTNSTARFQWGSAAVVAAGPPGPAPNGGQTFAIQFNGIQVGPAFPLNLNQIHQFGFNYQQVGLAAVYTAIVDGTIIGSYTGTIGVNGFSIPTQAVWAAYGVGASTPLTEEYYLDEIYVYDALLSHNFSTIGTGLTYNWTPGPNTKTVDLYFNIQVTGETQTPNWYKIANVQILATPGATTPGTFRLATPLPANAVIVQGPPTGIPPINYAQLQARVGAGPQPLRTLSKSVVRTKVANNVDELVRLGSIEMPPGSKAEYRNLDGWMLEVWGKSGGSVFAPLAIKGIVLFPEDEDGWTGITARAAGMPVAAEWHIGTNRWGRPYAQLFDSSGNLLGYADVSGNIGSMAGDNSFVVLTGIDDGQGHVLIDWQQQFQLGCQNIRRSHFEITEAVTT